VKGDLCNCIDLRHGHEPGSCGEPEPPTGAGVCFACLRFVPLNPGSDAALAAGCRCPVMDNNRGRGYLGQAGVFVMMADCPLHGRG
jgi:hypothetical protein